MTTPSDGDRLAAAAKYYLREVGQGACYCSAHESGLLCEVCETQIALAAWDAGAPLREAEEVALTLLAMWVNGNATDVQLADAQHGIVLAAAREAKEVQP